MSNESAPKCNCAAEESEEASPSNSLSELHCCMKQKNWLIFCDKRFSDICFIVGSESGTQKILAHKAMLSAGSPVFKTMFSKDWSSDSNEIKIPDIEAPVFSSLLRFIYIDDVQLTKDSVIKILYAAKKYSVLRLESQCANFLRDQLCPENACLILTQAKLFDQPNLMEYCFTEIDANPEIALMSDDFTNIDLALLCSLLERDTLQSSEVELFEATCRWSVAECLRENSTVNIDNQKKVLHGALSLIRFPVMTQKEFASSVLPFNLLSYEEVIDMFQYFSGCRENSLDFSSKPRSVKKILVADTSMGNEFISLSPIKEFLERAALISTSDLMSDMFE